MATRSKKAALSAVQTTKAKADPRLVDIQAAPSERWQRGSEYDVVALLDLDAGIDVERVQRAHNGVAALARSGRIGFPEVAAAARWTADYERSMRSSYCEPATAGIRGSGTNVGPENRYASGVDAATRHRQAREAVGVGADLLLRAVVADGRSLRSVATLIARRRAELETRQVAISSQLSEALAKGRLGLAEQLEVRRKALVRAVASLPASDRSKLSSDLADTLELLTEHYQDCDDNGQGGVLGRPRHSARRQEPEARLAA